MKNYVTKKDYLLDRPTHTSSTVARGVVKDLSSWKWCHLSSLGVKAELRNNQLLNLPNEGVVWLTYKRIAATQAMNDIHDRDEGHCPKAAQDLLVILSKFEMITGITAVPLRGQYHTHE